MTKHKSSSNNLGWTDIVPWTEVYLGQRWKNVDGFYKLQRTNGRIGAYISPNGSTWTQVGNEIEPPAELANIPVKLGYRVEKNWVPGYEFQVLSTVEHGDVPDIYV